MTVWTSESFSECVKEVYNGSGCYAMRIAVVEVAVTHFHELATKRAFLNLLKRGGDFACDYLIKIHQRYSIATWKLR
jgi:hypothetical protein